MKLLVVANDVDDPTRWNWASFEVFSLSLRPIALLRVSVGEQKSFRALLNDVTSGRILRRLRSLGRLELRYYQRSYYAKDNARWFMVGKYLTLKDVLTYPAQYVVENRSITLPLEDRFALMLCESEEERLKYLRGAAETRSSCIGCNSDGRSGEPDECVPSSES